MTKIKLEGYRREITVGDDAMGKPPAFAKNLSGGPSKFTLSPDEAAEKIQEAILPAVLEAMESVCLDTELAVAETIADLQVFPVFKRPGFFEVSSFTPMEAKVSCEISFAADTHILNVTEDEVDAWLAELGRMIKSRCIWRGSPEDAAYPR